MCGIVAMFAYGKDAPPADMAELRRMRDCMARRGPDGTGEWTSSDNRVAMGHRRLSIIDLRSVADQPMHHADRLSIVFNGEIYNYRELREDLEAKGHVFRTQSDTEVILQLYQAEGAKCVQKLRGMFAFALYDAEQDGVLLARDPLGIKPLYIAHDGKTLRVASQVKALLAGGNIDKRPEPAGHAGFFLWGNIPDPYTLYRGIRALPAGTTQWVDRSGGPRMPQTYWRISDALNRAPELSLSAGEQQERLRAALQDSLRHHFIADVPVGVFLSAGLDSTTIAALAAEDGAANLKTLTLGFREFENSPLDETALAELLARQLGTQHTTKWVVGREFGAERQALMEAMDQPSIDGINTYFVAKAAREAGLKVALSGLGGDELFAGYPSFRQIPKSVAALRPFAGPTVGAAFRSLAGPLLGRVTSPKYAGALEYGGTFGGAYLLRRSLFMPWELETVLPPDIARAGLYELDTVTRLDQDIDLLDNPRLKVTAMEMGWYMRNQLLRDSDWAGMAHSLEIRVPFVDATLVETLAPILASSRPPSKGDMADTPGTKLPTPIRERAKTGFVVPVRDWVRGETGPASNAADRGLRGWARLVHSHQNQGF